MAEKVSKEEQKGISRDEQIGFHKGSLQTLANERNELLKIVQITEALINAHVKALEELGVDVKAEMDNTRAAAEKAKKAAEKS